MISRALRWARANLFNGLFNGLLTVVLAVVLVAVLRALVDWALVESVWSAPNGRACQAAGSGACWAFLGVWSRFILFGRYPFDAQWRPAVVLVLFIALLLASTTPRLTARPLLALWVAWVVAALVLMLGGVFGLELVTTDLWNGLPLTMILAVVGLAVAFPLAVVLALGRRSTLPAVRALCVAYIELIRGVPLVTVLFMASVMLPLFLPQGVTIDKLMRAQAGFILFYAAYLAEVVRGGLNAVPRGQDEAADALGLTYAKKLRFVILPQALTISIPALVNIFIAGFKDTTLVAIIGLFDLLATAGTAITDPNWRGFYVEAYAFVAVIYFAFCNFMSRYSTRLERRLSHAKGR